MDIIGAIGYSGQDLVFLTQDSFGYITGKSICIGGTTTGPKEMIWRPDTGIGRIASHSLSHRLAIAPDVAGFDVEVVDFTGQYPPILLKNPSSAKLVDCTFSRDGEHIFAISGSLDPKVFAWNIKSRDVIFVSDLPCNFLKISVNPADRTTFVLSGDEGLYMGSIVEIMGTSAIKYDKINLDSAELKVHYTEEHSVEDKCAAAPNVVTFAVWAPFNRIFIGTKGGAIAEVNSKDLTLRVRAEMPKLETIEISQSTQLVCVPLCATLSSTHLIVGTSSGGVFWFPVVDIDSGNAGDQEGESPSGHIYQSSQSAQFDSSVCCLETDYMYATVLAGTSLGAIMKFPVDIAEVKRDEGDDDAAENLEVDRALNLHEEVLDKIIVATQVSISQAGAVLCSKSLSLPVLSTSETTPKTSVMYCSLFVTGSHSGMLTFWKKPSVDSEAIVKVKRI
jgi:WD40 repeat protein